MTRPESSSFPVLLIVGLVCGVLLIILLLLLLLVCLYHHYKKSKGEIYLSRMYVVTSVQFQIQRHVTAVVFLFLFFTESSFIRLIQHYPVLFSTWQYITRSLSNKPCSLHFLVPPGHRAPIRALLRTTWSTRMNLDSKKCLLLSMVSFNSDLFPSD